MNYESHQDNLFEVIELEKADNVEVRIGPEVHVGSVDEIKINSSFICFKCIVVKYTGNCKCTSCIE